MTPRYDFLRCPWCTYDLVQRGSVLRCSSCASFFRVENGVAVLGTTDPFYEGMANRPSLLPASRGSLLERFLYGVFYKFSIAGQRHRFLRSRALRIGGGRVLDLGCGGGNEAVTLAGDVTGLDVSQKGTTRSLQIYSHAVLQDLTTRLPFRDRFFNAVFCDDVLGHFARPVKQRILSEIHRVLDTDGHFVAVVETSSRNWLWNFARRDPDLFRQHFVEAMGHVGLECRASLLSLLQNQRFRIEKKKDLYPMGSAQDFEMWFDNDYQKRSRWLRLWMSLVRVSRRNRYAEALLNILLQPIGMTAGLFSKPECGLALMVHCRRESD